MSASSTKWFGESSNLKMKKLYQKVGFFRLKGLSDEIDMDLRVN